MITVRTAAESDFAAIKELYESAFPENERRPLEPMLRDFSGRTTIYTAWDDGEFAGFAIALTWRDILHIIYFAVRREMRNRGIGAETLRLIREENPSMRILVDVERPDPALADNPTRLRRIGFYERCGYEKTSVGYALWGENYIILANGGTIEKPEYDMFWKSMSAPKRDN